jgi:hypothetical protein
VQARWIESRGGPTRAARGESAPSEHVRTPHRCPPCVASTEGASGSSRRALRITPACSTSMAHGWRRGFVHTSERPRSSTFTAAIRQPLRVFRPGFDRHHAPKSPDARSATPTSCGNEKLDCGLCPNSTLWRVVYIYRSLEDTEARVTSLVFMFSEVSQWRYMSELFY